MLQCAVSLEENRSADLHRQEQMLCGLGIERPACSPVVCPFLQKRWCTTHMPNRAVPPRGGQGGRGIAGGQAALGTPDGLGRRPPPRVRCQRGGLPPLCGGQAHPQHTSAPVGERGCHPEPPSRAACGTLYPLKASTKDESLVARILWETFGLDGVWVQTPGPMLATTSRCYCPSLAWA